MPELLKIGTTAGNVIRTLEMVLKNAGIQEPGSEARLIAEKAAGFSQSRFSLSRELCFDQNQCLQAESFLKQRLTGMPIQYVLGEAWFYGYRFSVEPGVLIPRYDTEVLVEQALRLSRPGMKILDLCTGSGCIIISLAKEEEIEGYGSDLSEKALEVAMRNNREQGTDCSFIQSDLFNEIHDTYDIIVSNPPYIRSAVIDTLQREVKDHEPRLALDGGDDGLHIYRKIAEQAPGHLKPGGTLLTEIGYDQAEDVYRIFQRAGFREIDIVKDLSGNDRVIRAFLS